MTVNEAISFALEMRPHSLPQSLLLRWLAELEGRIAVMLLKKAPEGVSFADTEEALSCKLLAPAPFDRLYWSYLVAMIDLTVGDGTAYAMSKELFEEAYSTYAKWVQRTGEANYLA